MEAKVAPCPCGGMLLPVFVSQKIKDDPFEQEIHIKWKCSKCEKVVEE